MTTSAPSPTRPASRFQRFEADNRARAEQAGHPLRRLAIPAVHYPLISRMDPDASAPTYTLITRKNGKLLMRDLADESARFEPVDFPALAEKFLPGASAEVGDRTLNSIGGVIFTPDEHTTRYLIRRAAQQHERLGRALELASALPASTRLVELPAALGRKFFMPTGYDPSSLRDWARAFGLKAPPGSVRAARTLAGQLYVGLGGLTSPELPTEQPDRMGKIVREMVTLESALMRYAGAGGLSQDCGRFESVVGITSRWDYLTQTDELGRQQAMLDGTVFGLRHMGKNRYRIEGPFKVREGKRIALLPEPGEHADRQEKESMLVDKISMDAGGDFTLQGLAPRTSSLNDRFREADGPLLAIQAPFLPTFTGRAGTRWTLPASAEGAPQPKWRDVPMHVSLAGAPREDAHQAA